jgi:hypothetical protein
MVNVLTRPLLFPDALAYRSLDEALDRFKNWLDANPGRDVLEFSDGRPSLALRRYPCSRSSGEVAAS